MGWTIHHPKGLLYKDSAQAFEGYTLIAMSGGKEAFLIDMDGRVCHRWRRDEGLGYGFLLENGHLLARTRASGGTIPTEHEQTGILELDWDSNIVWAYWDRFVHHDFKRLPNGHTLVVCYELMPQEIARRVRGGRGSIEEPMYGDIVRELDSAGETVREWSMWAALDPETDAICPLDGREQWLHQNALSLTSDGDLLVSFRQIDTIGIVDRSTGQFTWKWGPGVISHQHHPTYQPNGRVLLFDNGAHRGGATYSRVIEVDPSSGQIAWEYTGDPPISFYSYHISGAERQPNGNTLVCEGAPGRIFEVTPQGEIVWEFVNPHRIPPGVPAGSGGPNSVFRAHRYAADHPTLAGRDLTPHDGQAGAP